MTRLDYLQHQGFKLIFFLRKMLSEIRGWFETSLYITRRASSLRHFVTDDDFY